MAKKRLANMVSFAATDEDAIALTNSAKRRRCSKSKILRELIRQNLSAMQKSPEAA